MSYTQFVDCVESLSPMLFKGQLYIHFLRYVVSSPQQYESESEFCSVVSYSLRPHGLYSSWTSLGQNTGVGILSLLQGIFPTQGSNPGLLHCRRILYQLCHKGSPLSVAPQQYSCYSFGFGWAVQHLSSPTRDLTHALCIGSSES